MSLHQLLAWLQKSGFSARLARGAASLTLIEVTALAVAYVSQVLFARWMGAADYGAYAYVIGWATLLAPFTTLGFPEAVLRLVPEYRARGNWARLAGVVRASATISVLAGIALALGGTAAVAMLERIGLISTPGLALGMWVAPLLGLVSLATSLARGMNRVASAFFPGMLLRPLLVTLGAVAVHLAGVALTSEMLLVVTIAVLPVILAVQAGVLRSARPAELAQTRPTSDIPDWLQIALPLLLAGLGSLVFTQTGLLVVGALAGPADAGLYNAAVRTASLMTLTLSITNSVAAPQFAALYARGAHEELQALTTAVARWAFWPSLAIAVGLIALAEPLLGLFGRAFVSARPILAILALGQLVNTGAGPVNTLLNMTGHHRTMLRVTAWVAGLHVVLTVLGVVYLGMIGAALAAAFSLALRNIWMHRMVMQRLGIDASMLHRPALAGSDPR